jgi:hypothetical protein
MDLQDPSQETLSLSSISDGGPPPLGPGGSGGGPSVGQGGCGGSVPSPPPLGQGAPPSHPDQSDPDDDDSDNNPPMQGFRMQADPLERD